eukprot:gene10407-5071_t
MAQPGVATHELYNNPVASQPSFGQPGGAGFQAQPTPQDHVAAANFSQALQTPGMAAVLGGYAANDAAAAAISPTSAGVMEGYHPAASLAGSTTSPVSAALAHTAYAATEAAVVAAAAPASSIHIPGAMVGYTSAVGNAAVVPAAGAGAAGAAGAGDAGLKIDALPRHPAESVKSKRPPAKRPWKCKPCTRSFVHKASLVKHNFNEHGKTEADTGPLIPDTGDDPNAGPKKDAPYDPDDDKIFPVIIDGKLHNLKGDTRLVVQNKITEKKLAGQAAPRVKQITQWIAEHPDYEIVLAGKVARGRPGRPRQKPAAAATTTITAGGGGGSGGAGKTGRGRGASASKKVQLGRVVWTLESHEEGIASVFVKELKALNRYAHKSFVNEQWEQTIEDHAKCYDMAKKALECVKRAQSDFDALPDP